MALKVGDKVPEVLGLTQDGKELKMSDFAGRKVVLYFYPKDNTSGCTAEACSLRDNYDALRTHGCEVVGMVAAYTYGFPTAEKAFAEAGVELTTLTNYEAVVETALATGYIEEKHVALLHDWRSNPSEWGK